MEFYLTVVVTFFGFFRTLTCEVGTTTAFWLVVGCCGGGGGGGGGFLSENKISRENVQRMKKIDNVYSFLMLVYVEDFSHNH